MLGCELLPVRLAGISALKRLATDYHEEYHLQVLALFCGFARNPTGKQEDQVRQPMDLEKLKYEDSGYREDVETAVNVICQRGRAGRELEADANFNVDLHGAELTRITLEDADLTGANLSRAHLPLVYATNVDLSGASFHSALLYEMSGHHLELCGASLLGANLTFMKALFTNFFRASLGVADLYGANLEGSNFRVALFVRNNLTATNLVWADFSGAQLAVDVAIAQYQLNEITWDRGNPLVLPSRAIDVTTNE